MIVNEINVFDINQLSNKNYKYKDMYSNAENITNKFSNLVILITILLYPQIIIISVLIHK